MNSRKDFLQFLASSLKINFLIIEFQKSRFLVIHQITKIEVFSYQVTEIPGYKSLKSKFLVIVSQKSLNMEHKKNQDFWSQLRFLFISHKHQDFWPYVTKIEISGHESKKLRFLVINHGNRDFNHRNRDFNS